MGRAASTGSYLGSAVLTVAALNTLQPSSFRDQLLSDIAAGGGTEGLDATQRSSSDLRAVVSARAASAERGSGDLGSANSVRSLFRERMASFTS